MTAHYGKATYWDDRYTKDPEVFDWYQVRSSIRFSRSRSSWFLLEEALGLLHAIDCIHESRGLVDDDSEPLEVAVARSAIHAPRQRLVQADGLTLSSDVPWLSSLVVNRKSTLLL